MITLSENGKWKNGKTGILSKDEGYFRLRFIEMNNSMDKYIHSPEKFASKCPIIATGFLAYLIETIQTDNNISSFDIYEKYFNYQYQHYLNKVKISPDYDENETKRVFVKTYIKDEKNHIEKSKTLYDYLPDDKANLIKKHIESYFKYISEKQLSKGKLSSSKEKNKTRQEPTDEGLEVIKSYFNSCFYFIDQNGVNYFEECLKPDLRKIRRGYEYATIALIIFNCKHVNSRKMPKSFKQWYKIFCKNMNIKECTFKPNQLDTSKFSSEMYYLQPRE